MKHFTGHFCFQKKKRWYDGFIKSENIFLIEKYF